MGSPSRIAGLLAKLRRVFTSVPPSGDEGPRNMTVWCPPPADLDEAADPAGRKASDPNTWTRFVVRCPPSKRAP